jgi:hypothetical protein
VGCRGEEEVALCDGCRVIVCCVKIVIARSLAASQDVGGVVDTDTPLSFKRAG